MRRYLLSILVLAVLAGSLSGLLVPAKVLALTPGCYVYYSQAIHPLGDCNNVKNAFPDKTIDPSRCYAVDGPGPVLTKFREFSCNTNPTLNAGCYTSVVPPPPTTIDCNTVRAMFPGTTITDKGCYALTKPGVPALVTFDCGTYTPIGQPVKQSIPNGCPDSTDPTANIDPKLCEAIPAGCPGSTVAGPAASPTPNCPYVKPTASTPSATPTTPTGGTTPADSTATPASGSIGSVTRKKAIDCDGSTPEKLQACLKINPLVQTVQYIINFLGIGVGVIVVIMIILGGIQYSAAGSNPQAVGAAKKKILNAVFSFAAFILMYSLLQWLVPGGIF